MHGKPIYLSDVLDRYKNIFVVNVVQEDKSKSYTVEIYPFF